MYICIIMEKLPQEVKEYLDFTNELRKERVLEEMLKYCEYNNITLEELVKLIKEEDNEV